jgi:hypothetical protein
MEPAFLPAMRSSQGKIINPGQVSFQNSRTVPADMKREGKVEGGEWDIAETEAPTQTWGLDHGRCHIRKCNRIYETRKAMLNSDYSFYMNEDGGFFS